MWLSVICGDERTDGIFRACHCRPSSLVCGRSRKETMGNVRAQAPVLDWNGCEQDSGLMLRERTHR